MAVLTRVGLTGAMTAYGVSSGSVAVAAMESITLSGLSSRYRVNERNSLVIECDVLDEDGDGISPSALDSLTLTLFDMDTRQIETSPYEGILNDRDEQDVLNANDVTLDEDGHFTWKMRPDDNAIVTLRRQIERHRAKLVFAWPGHRYTVEIPIDVVNQSRH